MKFYTVEIEARRRLGAYTLLSYRWPGDGIEAGRFVMARAAGYPVTLDPFLARPFSFYDFEGGVASLLFEVRGRGTALLDRARETIEVTAPLGKGFEIDASTGRAALLGGGIGVAPLKILGRELASRGIDHDVFLGFLDAKTAAVADDFPGASVATMDGSAGTRGTVLDAAPDLLGYPAVYACGPNAMLAAVKGAAGQDGLRQLSVEERMGCGNGSCNGCVVPVDGGYVRSCVEGPVFRAEVLAW
ncbi:NAD-dependent dihydroorotate dehydrogenase B electron transfer subunit [Rubrobacter tropicus]|uniref:NAD-dependent dihydroorotate dehydrogenase B electron transfer subunit n=1 Tax=Rubrobacter tropicus TaxID=2653851 RepID=A0A6G8Q9F6_9ACTN|nr:dihydroorotate dehydrogenase electron transfer subunit [Rubrobacter tropicus]QIN83058.1 NAD-dependent dihydroorotate dehydrogenase B electron transfer subunit [Rubrobacter tropicus]